MGMTQTNIFDRVLIPERFIMNKEFNPINADHRILANETVILKVNMSCNCDPDSQCADVFRRVCEICEYDSESDIVVKFSFDRMELLIKNARLEECDEATRLIEHVRDVLEKEGRTLIVIPSDNPRTYHSALRAWRYNCVFQPPFSGEICLSTSAYSSDRR